MKQTAVDILVYKIHQELEWFYPKIKLSPKLIDEIKAIEKEQIAEAFEHVDYNLDDGIHYYEKTYKSE